MSQAKTFGRYNLIRKVAQGGMAEIFLAKFQGIGGFEKKIIIKRILPRFSENREFINMLIHEAKTAVQLHHQNIVQIYDLGKVRDTYFISMEYIRGKDLRTVLNRLKSQGQLMRRELAIFIAREICKGLDYAHNITDHQGQPLNLVHRDISPPNVLLSLEGEVKIIDFGIAKATSQATDTQAGVFKGKFAYMAPEQASGLPVDRRADIFATGLILWEMLTCRKLLEAESDIMTLERAKRIDSYEIPSREYEIPEQLEHIIRKALRQDRGVRYQSAGEMARDLTIYLNLNYPGFSETDLADFLRTLFNLDKRRGASSGEMITHGQGERSLTGSDFFRAFAQTGQDRTDPSFKVPQDGTPRPGPLPGHADAAAAAGISPQGAVSSMPAARRDARPRANDRPRQSDNEFWDLRDEIEVFARGNTEDSAPQKADPGWVSQVADDFVRADDGTLHPLISGGLQSVEGGDALPSGESQNNGAAHDLARGTGAGTGPTALHAGELAGSGPHAGHGASLENAWWRSVIAGLVIAIVIIASILAMRTPPVSFPLAFQPSDAEVLINGIVQSEITNPATLSLEVGKRYSLLIRKDGYLAREIVVDLIQLREQGPINVSLEPVLASGQGKLELVGVPEGARVYVNGAPVELEALHSLPTDQPIRLLVTREHYQDFVLEVPALGETPQVVTVGMQPKPVPLRVDTRPVGATVRVNGKVVGTAPISWNGLVPGQPHRVEIQSAGHQTLVREVVPQLGVPFVLDVELVALERAPANPPRTVERPDRNSNPGTTRPVPTLGTGTATEPGSSPGGSGGTEAPPPGTTGDPAGPGPQTILVDPPRDPPGAKKREKVLLSIVVTPFAEVFIDGRYIGRTPLKNVSVSVGAHKIRFVNRDLQVDYEQEMAFDGSTEVVPLKFDLGY